MIQLLKKLDLSNNLELEMLRCGEIFEQGIRGLDISKNTKLKKLICDDLILVKCRRE